MRTRAWLIVFAFLVALGLSACRESVGPENPAMAIDFPPGQNNPFIVVACGPTCLYGFEFRFRAQDGYFPAVEVMSTNPSVARIIGNPDENLTTEGLDSTRVNMRIWRQLVLFNPLSLGRTDIVARLVDNPSMRFIVHVEVVTDPYCMNCKGVSSFDLTDGMRLLHIVENMR